MKPLHILISRTDSIGDVVLTLPLAGLLRRQYPEARIDFLGQTYTRPVIEACVHIDAFYDWQEIRNMPAKERVAYVKNIGADHILHVFPRREIAQLACEAGIPIRIGTTGRLYHWFNCNRLVRLSRRHSLLHEAQLNILLAKNLISETDVTPGRIPSLYGISNLKPLREEIKELIDTGRFNLVLHPKSKGSAREWGTDNFAKLATLLPPERFRIFITGTKEEGELLQQEGFFEKAGEVVNLCGKLSLDELISFIGAADGLVAASTGPLHLAAALGKVTLGIYPPIKPMHPGRWAPLGIRAGFVTAINECSDCRKGGPCHCMLSISAEQVKQKLESMVYL